MRCGAIPLTRATLLTACSPARAAGDVEKHFLQRRPVVAQHDLVGAVVVLDAAALHDDDAVAQPLDLEHVVRRQKDGGAMVLR